MPRVYKREGSSRQGGRRVTLQDSHPEAVVNDLIRKVLWAALSSETTLGGLPLLHVSTAQVPSASAVVSRRGGAVSIPNDHSSGDAWCWGLWRAGL